MLVDAYMVNAYSDLVDHWLVREVLNNSGKHALEPMMHIVCRTIGWPLENIGAITADTKDVMSGQGEPLKVEVTVNDGGLKAGMAVLVRVSKAADAVTLVCGGQATKVSDLHSAQKFARNFLQEARKGFCGF